MANIALWIMPSNKSKDDLLLIDNIELYEHPHITILTMQSDIKKVIGIAKNFKKPEICLEILDVESTNDFFMSCYLTFKPNKELIELQSMLGSKFNRKSKFKFVPHLSLCYGEECIKTTALKNFYIGKKIVCDHFAICQGADNWKEVDLWKIHTLDNNLI